MTDKFRIRRLTVTGRAAWQPDAFAILLLIEGECVAHTATEQVALRPFDRVVIPHGLPPLEFESPRAVFLECLPPLPR